MRKIVLLLSSILIAPLAEVMLRLVHAAPEVQMIQKGASGCRRTKIGFEPVPGLDYTAPSGLLDYEGASNSQGFRDTKHTLAKPAASIAWWSSATA